MTDLHQALRDGNTFDGQPYGVGFTRTLGLVLDEVTGQRVRAWAQVDARHHQEQGIVHGGWYAAVIETVASLGAYSAGADDRTTVVGVSNTTEFFRSVRQGRLDVVAQPVHRGRTQQVWEVRINRPDDGKLVARGQVRLQHVERRPA